MSIFNGLFGDPNAKEIKKIQPIIDQINGLEPSIQTLSDEGLKAKTAEFKQRLSQGEALDLM
nr:hypothetical protein [Patescibacteria group bacterium]